MNLEPRFVLYHPAHEAQTQREPLLELGVVAEARPELTTNGELEGRGQLGCGDRLLEQELTSIVVLSLWLAGAAVSN